MPSIVLIYFYLVYITTFLSAVHHHFHHKHQHQPIVDRHVNDTSSQLGDLKFCSRRDIFVGEWRYWQNEPNHFPSFTKNQEVVEFAYQHCPRTLSLLSNHSVLSYQPVDYSCNPSKMKPAHFIPRNCVMRSYHDSVHQLQQQLRSGSGGSSDASSGREPIHVTFMGDSLGGQMFAAFDCAMQFHNLSGLITSEYVVETFFRRGIPCDHNCTTTGDAGKFFRMKQKENPLHDMCGGCPDGIRHNISEFEYNSIWKLGLTKRMDFLVLNAGAWYSYFGHVDNSSFAYRQTLELILVPVLKQVMSSNLRLKVYWICLPPFIARKEQLSTSLVDEDKFVDCTTKNIHGHNLTEAEVMFRERNCFREERSKKAFEWHLMGEKDDFAKEILQPIGVHVIDPNAMLRARKAFDPQSSTDGLHWCNPGIYTVPPLLVRALLHIFAEM